MANSINIKFSRIRVTVNHSSATDLAREEGVRRVTQYCRKTMNQAIINCPVDTGNLRAHHRQRISPGQRKVTGTVYNDANYASLVHDGSSPHTISGRNASRTRRGVKTLRFTIGGQVIYRRSVRHPGSRGRPWLRDAARKVAASEGFIWT